MSCNKDRSDIYALFDGELDAIERAGVLAHWETCAQCQMDSEADRRLKALVQKQLAIPPALPPGLWGGVERRIAEAENDSRSRQTAWAKVGKTRAPWVLVAMAATVVLALVWGPSKERSTLLVEEIEADHLRSVMKAGGPVDIPTSDPGVISDRLRGRGRDLVYIPELGRAGAKLLGGSVCQFSETKGSRITYRLTTNAIVSFYQLERSGAGRFPRPGAPRLYVGPLDPRQGPALVVWGDQRFVYALVGAIPWGELQRLSSLI